MRIACLLSGANTMPSTSPRCGRGRGRVERAQRRATAGLASPRPARSPVASTRSSATSAASRARPQRSRRRPKRHAPGDASRPPPGSPDRLYTHDVGALAVLRGAASSFAAISGPMPLGSPSEQRDARTSWCAHALDHSALMLASWISLPKRSYSARFIVGELLEREVARLAAQPLEPRLHVGQLEDAHEFRVEPVDDRLRRPAGDEQAVPRRHLGGGIAGLGDRRHVRQFGRALRRRHGERLELAGLDLRHRRRRRVEHHLRPGRRGGRRAPGCEPLYGTWIVFDAGGQVERFAGDVLRAADAGRCVLEHAGLRLRQRDQVLHVLRRHLVADDEHVGHDDDEPDRLQVLQRIVRRA